MQVIGARPGEKRHEELVDDDEAPVPAGHAGIVVAVPPRPDPAALRRRLREMEALAGEGRRDELADALRQTGTPREDRVAAAVGESS